MIPSAVFTRSRSSRTLNGLTMSSFTPEAFGRRTLRRRWDVIYPQLGHGTLYEEKPAPICLTKGLANSHRQAPLPGIALGRPSITEKD